VRTSREERECSSGMSAISKFGLELTEKRHLFPIKSKFTLDNSNHLYKAGF